MKFLVENFLWEIFVMLCLPMWQSWAWFACAAAARQEKGASDLTAVPHTPSRSRDGEQGVQGSALQGGDGFPQDKHSLRRGHHQRVVQGIQAGLPGRPPGLCQLHEDLQQVFPNGKRRRVLRPRLPDIWCGQERLHWLHRVSPRHRCHLGGESWGETKLGFQVTPWPVVGACLVSGQLLTKFLHTCLSHQIWHDRDVSSKCVLLSYLKNSCSSLSRRKTDVLKRKKKVLPFACTAAVYLWGHQSQKDIHFSTQYLIVK